LQPQVIADYKIRINKLLDELFWDFVVYHTAFNVQQIDSWCEETGRSAHSEIAELRSRLADYMTAICSFDPGKRSQRLEKIQNAKNRLNETPNADTLRNYQTILKLKPPKDEKAILQAVDKGWVDWEQINKDVVLVQEFHRLVEFCKDKLLEKLRAATLDTMQAQEKCWHELVAKGVDPMTNERFQILRKKNSDAQLTEKKGRDCYFRLEELKAFPLLKNLNGEM